jgi:hypothetical protein
MSKTQDKRAARIAETKAFVRERREVQLKVFEANFEAGLELFNNNKDKMTTEEIAMIEAEIEQNRQIIENIKKEWGFE